MTPGLKEALPNPWTTLLKSLIRTWN